MTALRLHGMTCAGTARHRIVQQGATQRHHTTHSSNAWQGSHRDQSCSCNGNHADLPTLSHRRAAKKAPPSLGFKHAMSACGSLRWSAALSQRLSRFTPATYRPEDMTTACRAEDGLPLRLGLHGPAEAVHVHGRRQSRTPRWGGSGRRTPATCRPCSPSSPRPRPPWPPPTSLCAGPPAPPVGPDSA